MKRISNLIALSAVVLLATCSSPVDLEYQDTGSIVIFYPDRLEHDGTGKVRAYNSGENPSWRGPWSIDQNSSYVSIKGIPSGKYTLVSSIFVDDEQVYCRNVEVQVSVSGLARASVRCNWL